MCTDVLVHVSSYSEWQRLSPFCPLPPSPPLFELWTYLMLGDASASLVAARARPFPLQALLRTLLIGAEDKALCPLSCMQGIINAHDWHLSNAIHL